MTKYNPGILWAGRLCRLDSIHGRPPKTGAVGIRSSPVQCHTDLAFYASNNALKVALVDIIL